MCYKVLDSLDPDDKPLFELALELEQVALKDDYFIEKNLYPNVDYYSGIIYRALGIPRSMFTVMFALGRSVGWVAHWREMISDPKGKIARPRQLYVGAAARDYIPSFRVDAPHWLTVDRTYRRLSNTIDREYRCLDRFVAVAEFETRIHLDLAAAAFEASLVGPKRNPHVANLHRDHFRAVCEQVQVDRRVLIGCPCQYRADQSWRKFGE
jgi:hypothetical protein